MKEEILQTSLSQFLRYGIREVSIQKLVEPLGISTKTVYKYFKNKEELLEDALSLLNMSGVKEWEKMLATHNTVVLFFEIWRLAVEAEYNVSKAFYYDLHHYYPALDGKYEAMLTKKYKHQFVEIIQRGIEEGLFLTTVNAEVSLESISVLFKAIARQGHFKNFKLSAHTLTLNILAVFIRGFCTQKGARLLEVHIHSIK